MDWLVVAASVACCAVAQAQPAAPEFDWVTIGAPGNRSANQQEAPSFYPPNFNPPLLAGAVGYEYRITRTEVTVAQWFEFLNDYWPHFNGVVNHPALVGFWIRASNTTPGQNPGYYIPAGAENRPMDTSWHVAARFMNWLHNGKINEAWAFETGAYDTSTFTQNANGTWNDQPHLPGARFWIPTLDEWTKAMHYDPDRYGPGQEGYWRYPHASDTPPISGWPWDGGETSAGLKLFSGPWLDVGSYPWADSPWGLLDGSGSETEWLEWMAPDLRGHGRRGTRQFGSYPEIFDRVDHLVRIAPNHNAIGFRITTAVPAPSTGLALGVGAYLVPRRRHR